jgi:hypothetical protein
MACGSFPIPRLLVNAPIELATQQAPRRRLCRGGAGAT